MKGYTDFAMGLWGPEAVATKPIGKMKYIDWIKVEQAVKEHPDSVIYAGLQEDWNNTSGLVFAHGKFYDGYVFGASVWATPIVDVDGEEIECWTHNKPKGFTTDLPSWWGRGETVHSWCSYEEDSDG